MFKQIKRGITNRLVRFSYPDWTKISGEIQSVQAPSDKQKLQKSILLAPTLGIQSSVVIINGYLAMALRARGARVVILQCGGVLPICQVAVENNYDAETGMPKSICKRCFKNANKSFASTGATVVTYDDYVTKTELERAKEISDSIDPENITEYEYQGVKIGEHAVAGALKFFARGTLLPGMESESILRKYLAASIVTYTVINKLIKQFRIDVSSFHHGIYVPEGVIGETCRTEGVRVVNWNPAYRKGSFIFSHTDTYHHTLMEEDTSTWEHLPWTDELDKRTIDYLDSRYTGGKDWITFVGENPIFDLKNLKEVFPSLNYDKPIIGLLTNVVWDAQLHYPANIFENMLEWIIETVEYFRNRIDLQLLIRVHPAEVLGELPSKQRVAEELKKHFDLDTLRNVFLVDSPSPLSTLRLRDYLRNENGSRTNRQRSPGNCCW